jgi:hypothetical protein
VRFQVAEDGRLLSVQARFADGRVGAVSDPSSLRDALEEIRHPAKDGERRAEISSETL